MNAGAHAGSGDHARGGACEDRPAMDFVSKLFVSLRPASLSSLASHPPLAFHFPPLTFYSLPAFSSLPAFHSWLN